eukprot:5832526-Lingulodinium_polyedra.AAC.1
MATLSVSMGGRKRNATLAYDAERCAAKSASERSAALQTLIISHRRARGSCVSSWAYCGLPNVGNHYIIFLE